MGRVLTISCVLSNHSYLCAFVFGYVLKDYIVKLYIMFPFTFDGDRLSGLGDGALWQQNESSCDYSSCLINIPLLVLTNLESS